MIKQITIQDFRSIRHCTVDFGETTVLVGRSGTGKSNIVRALRFLRNYLLADERAIAHEGGWVQIVPAGLEKPATSIGIRFLLPGEEREFFYQLTFGLPRGQQTFAQLLELRSERLSLGGETLLQRERKPNWEWIKEPDLAPLPSPSNSAMLGSFPALEKLVFAHAGLSNGIGYYHFPSSALDTRKPLDPRQEISKSIPGLLDDAQNYRETMRAITQDFRNPHLRKSILASLKEVNSSVVSIELDSLTDPRKAMVGHSSGGKTFALELQEESDGFRRFYAHLLALYQTPPKLTLVFEEPENAIFPGALAMLADEFKAAPRENRGQVILTTHSPTLLDSFDVESLRVVELHNGQTRVGPVAKEQQEAVRNHLLRTGELLTVERAKIDPDQQAA